MAAKVTLSDVLKEGKETLDVIFPGDPSAPATVAADDDDDELPMGWIIGGGVAVLVVLVVLVAILRK